MNKLGGNKKTKGDIKTAIINAAKKLILEKGFEATSLRKIAAEIGYSPTTIYLYYKDKNDIIYALHQDGFNLFRSKLDPLMTIEDSFERLKALGESYITFAKEHPDYYELMFMLKEPMKYLDSGVDKELWDNGRELFGFLLMTVKECQKEGYFYHENSNHIAMQAWGSVHGLCSLYITTRLERIVHKSFDFNASEELLNSAFKTYIDLIESTKNNNK